MIGAIFALQITLASLAVIDGDTLHDNGGNREYRLFGIDAPETDNSKCDAERALGYAASMRAYELLASAEKIVGKPGRDPRGRDRWPRDGFGRRLARIEMLIEGVWVDLGDTLVAEGLARPYSGNGPRPDWCAG